MTDLAREYGGALYELAAECGRSRELLEQARELKSIFRQEPDFLHLLNNRALGIRERLDVLDKVLRGRIDPYLLNFLKILCERGALNEYEGCEHVFRDRYNEDHDVAIAAVTTAKPLSDTQRQRLTERLQEMTGREISLTERVDPQVMGGVRLEINGHRWDNTVRGRLDSLRRALNGEA